MACMDAKSLQPCPTLCSPTDYSPPGSSVHGILQARKLEWIVMPSSRGSSRPRSQTPISNVSCIGGLILYHVVRGSRNQITLQIFKQQLWVWYPSSECFSFCPICYIIRTVPLTWKHVSMRTCVSQPTSLCL